MLRAALVIGLGWVLMAAVAGLGHAFALTIMLPSTTAILVCQVAFDRERSLPAGLAVAIILGYLEDLHQGLPTGTLSLSFGLVYLAFAWLSLRVQAEGTIVRAIAAGLACLAADLLTWAILVSLADPLDLSRPALQSGLRTLHWHALATMLAAPAVWGMIAGLGALIRRIGAQGTPRPHHGAPAPGPAPRLAPRFGQRLGPRSLLSPGSTASPPASPPPAPRLACPP
ncbi:MAG: hypothetical protein R3B09_30785 [Nannocystaceae bacterium]